MNIILAGMPASGKTTVSAELGKLLSLDAVDTDALIVEKYGEISAIFENYGEEYFRDLETQTVKEVCKLENCVISTGGGCLLRKKNTELFRKSGKIIYLKASLETLVKRTEGDTTRPLLKGGAAERLEKLLAARASIYEQAADFIVETDGFTPQQIALKIKELVGEKL